MATPVTVTATLTDPSSNALQGNSYVRFRLRNFAGFVPRVQSSAVLPETQVDALPNGSGLISQTLWKNSDIVPSTTFYTVEFWNQGRITSSGNYLFNGDTDLDVSAQLNAPPVPPGFLLVLENNGALNSSQSTLNLESTDGTVVITDEGIGTLNLQAKQGAVSGSNVWPAGWGGWLTSNPTPLVVGGNTIAQMLPGRLAFSMPTSWKVTFTASSGTCKLTTCVVAICDADSEVINSTVPVKFSGVNSVNFSGSVTTDAIGIPIDADHDYYILAFFDGSSSNLKIWQGNPYDLNWSAIYSGQDATGNTNISTGGPTTETYTMFQKISVT